MAKLRIYLLITIVFFLALKVKAQISRDSAINLVLNHILVDEIGHIDVFASLDIQSDDNVLSLPDFRTIQYPYSFNWVFFVDDKPHALWEHSCRYIFVDSNNGGYNIVDDLILPIGLANQFEVISQIQLPHPTSSIAPPSSVSNATPNSHLYAVIILGCPCLAPCPNCKQDYSFWNDISALYTTLITVYGYKKENIFVHYFRGPFVNGNSHNDLDGDGNLNGISDIDSSAYRQSIDNTFMSLSVGGSNELHEDDQLFVYISDHGGNVSGHSFICLPYPNDTNNYDELMDTTFSRWVQNIKCAQMIYLMQQCNSGGFKSKLMDYLTYPPLCKNRTIQTSVSATEDSWPEYWITGGNFHEFSYYWTAAVRGFFPYINPDTSIGPQPWKRGDSVYHFLYLSKFYSCMVHPDYNPDRNEDGIVTMDEAFHFADDYNSWSGFGQSQNFFCEYPLAHCNVYPCPPETPDSARNISFNEDLQSLYGLTGEITSPHQTVESRSYAIGGPFKIINGATLNFQPGSQVYFINPGCIDVDIHSKLNPGTSMFFEGGPENSVLIEGSMGPLNGVSFCNDTYDKSIENFGGLYLDNPDLATKMDSVHFTHAGFLQHHGQSLKIGNNANFTNCDHFISYSDSIDISHSSFSNTFVYLSNVTPHDTGVAVIDSNTFNTSTNPYGSDLIDINGFGKFNIFSNSIYGANNNGIGLYSCGHARYNNQNILRNLITYCDGYGINVYNSNVVIYNNQIHHNYRGLNLLDCSNVQVLGNKIANYWYETQRIVDNAYEEIYTNDQSFPSIKYNMIYDNNDQNGMLIYDDGCDTCTILDVTYNCWGNNEIPQQLGPNHEMYSYDPTWCPHDPDQPEYGQDEAMLNNADSLFGAGNYTEGQALYLSLVEEFPHTRSSQSALKELYDIEQYASNDFNSLKQYYLTNDTILNDTALSNVASFLANRCNVHMENWSQAIDWYENRILNPPSEVDSICAIIDLEEIYLLMQNGGSKLTYIGKLPQYKPSSLNRYCIYRDSLLALLPFDHQKKTPPDPMSKLTTNALLQNVPNPFSETCNITYKLGPYCTCATIIITDNLGRIRNTIELPDVSAGVHKITINSSGLTQGIYQYSFKVNGQKTDTKKMVVIR